MIYINRRYARDCMGFSQKDIIIVFGGRFDDWIKNSELALNSSKTNRYKNKIGRTKESIKKSGNFAFKLIKSIVSYIYIRKWFFNY